MEDDIRTFAERSDHTEVSTGCTVEYLCLEDPNTGLMQGFMLTTPISDGFGGLASVFLEMLRDEFNKSTIFSTATMSDSLLWKRPDTDVSSLSLCLFKGIADRMLRSSEISKPEAPQRRSQYEPLGRSLFYGNADPTPSCVGA